MPPSTSRCFGVVAFAALLLPSSAASADAGCIPQPVVDSLAGALQAPLHAEADFTQARAAYDAADLPKAAVLLRRVALRGADTVVGIHAAQLYLDAVNRLGTAGAPSCLDDMSRDVPTFLDLYCQGERAKPHADVCDVLERVQMNVLRLRAEQQVGDAEKGTHDPDAAYEAAGDLYLGLWTRYGEAACLAKEAGCERMDEILYDAAQVYQAARRPEKALATRRLLLDPRYGLHRGELAQRTRYELGGYFQVIGAYDEAATWYEDFARTSPQAPRAPDALRDAVRLRLALGQMDRASASADLFAKNYGAKSPANNARVALSVATALLSQDDLVGAQRRLQSSMAMMDRDGSIDVQIRAHTALGEALERLGKTPAAAVEHGKAVALYRDPESVVRRLQGLDEASRDRVLVAILTAVGESLFFSAEQKRRAAEQLQRPTYGGAGDAAAVARYFDQTLSGWLKEKQQAIDDAEKAYAEIVNLQPKAPPRWVVAAGVRVARMRSKLAAELRSAPPPKTWRTTGASPWGATWEELRRGWTATVETATLPLLQRAKEANRRCVALTAQYAYADGDSPACADWLARHFPAEYPDSEGILPALRRGPVALVPAPVAAPLP
jgi:tetratricopeptide (TPR) repeat protein